MLFIVNPTAARGRAVHVWREARRELGRRESPSRSTSRAAQARPPRSRAQPSATGSCASRRRRRRHAPAKSLTGTSTSQGGRSIRSRRWGSCRVAPAPTSAARSGWRRPPTRCGRSRAGGPRSLDAARIAFAGGGGVERSRHLINLASFGLGRDAVRLVSDWRGRWPRWVEVARASSRRRSARSGATATPTSASAWTGRAS